MLLAAISYEPIVHIPIGPLRISPHGIGIAAGFLAGVRLLLPQTRRHGYEDDDVYAVLFYTALGALLGARLAYVVNHLPDYLDDPLDVFRVWEGGISLMGGILGAMALSLPAMKRHGIDLWKGFDAAAPGLALGIVVGRVGDLIVADHLGKPTDFFLGYKCPPAAVETASPCVGDVVHQTALYDLLLTAGLLAVLLGLRHRKADRYDGFLIITFGAFYGVFRLIEDFLREDLRRFGLTGSQMTAIVVLTICWSWLLFVRRTPRWGHWEANEEDRPTMAAGPSREAAGAEQPSPTSEEAEE